MHEIDGMCRPEKWPANDREWLLSAVYEALWDYVEDPGCRTKEVLLTLVHNYDANQRFSRGMVRITAYEVALINRLYLMAADLWFCSIKTFLYSLVAQTTRMHRMMSRMYSNDPEMLATGKPLEVDGYRALIPELGLYEKAYYRFRELREKEDLCTCIIDCVRIQLALARTESQKERVVCSFVGMMNDISYQRGVRLDSVIRFSRDELFRLFKYEIELTRQVGQDSRESPLKGVLMTQFSNYILKSRNDYNDKFLLKYVPSEVAEKSIENNEIWMRCIADLNDEREGHVLDGILSEVEREVGWVKGIDTRPTRLYYVSSFSKAWKSEQMQKEYGECVYGYKGDRLTDLFAPIVMQKPEFKGLWKGRSSIPRLSQVVVMDVVYNRESAKRELKYLCSIVDLFDIADAEKRSFLEEILQYWSLSVKDEGKWAHEEERRYVLFLYERSKREFVECKIDKDGWLKLKTTAFLFPDFVLGQSPVRDILRSRANEKRGFAVTNDYLYCHDCFNRDYDAAIRRENRCPICQSRSVELVKCNYVKAMESRGVIKGA